MPFTFIGSSYADMDLTPFEEQIHFSSFFMRESETTLCA